jgi:hypothetical protein
MYRDQDKNIAQRLEQLQENGSSWGERLRWSYESGAGGNQADVFFIVYDQDAHLNAPDN